jgi:6-phosphogluconolactonase (cycloisomerase 2 family)
MCKKNFLLFSILILAICTNAQRSYVFIGSYNADKNTPGIYIFELDTLSGQLKEVSVFKNIRNPSFLTLSPNGKFVFACTETQTANSGSVTSFSFDPTTKSLTLINTQKSGGENPVYVSVDINGRWLINANYTSGSASVFRIDEKGKISPAIQAIYYTDSSINKSRQDHSHIHSAVFSPDNKYVFFPDLGADKIRVYQFDTLKNEPFQNGNSIKTFPASGPRHIIFNSNGNVAYCIEEMGGAVGVYRFKNGVLKPVQRSIMHPENSENNSPKKIVSYSSADIHLSPDGRFLYASNREPQNNIAIFSVKKNGKLKAIGYDSTYGTHPRNFAIDPTGKFLIVANQISGNIIVFRRDLSTGKLEKTGEEIKVESPSCVKIGQY